jgi:acetyltransferase
MIQPLKRRVIILKDTTSLTLDGRTITIRPIRSTDIAMEANFVRRLSPLTKHYRFFGMISELPDEQVRKFCEVDGDQSMAYVATLREGEREVEVGVCRYVPAAKSDAREMAVTIADEWQHSGLARILAQPLIGSAKRHGVRELFAVELSDNHAMAKFAAELGMQTARDPADATQVIYSLAL